MAGSPADNRKADPAVHPWVAQVRNATYKRIATGTWFLTAGIILLLNTLDRLPWGVWIDLLRLWPLLVISLGIRWTFVRTPLHPLALLGPLLVVGSAGYVVWSGLSHQPEAIRWGAREIEKTVSIACPGGAGAARLDLGFDAGRLSLVSGRGDGAKGIAGSLRYAGDEPPRACSGKRLRLGRESRLPHVRFLSPLRLGAKRWEARLAAPEPLAVNARVTAAAADLDLTGFALRDVALDAAGSDVALRLGAPAGRVRVDLTGAFSSIKVFVPEGTCWSLTRRRKLSFVRIDGERNAARSITSPACGAARDGARYDIDVDLPIANVRVDTASD